MFVIFSSHLFFTGTQFGDSSYYVDWAENDRTAYQGGYVPSLLFSAPLSSLVIQTLIKFVPFFALYAPPLLFLVLILITFVIFKNRRGPTTQYRNFLHFYLATPFSIFMFPGYIEYYVVSFFIVLLLGIILTNYKLSPLLQSILVGFASLTHLLFLPLLLLNFLLLKDVSYRVRFFYSIVGFISSVSLILIIGKLAGLDFIRGNLPVEDSFTFNLTNERLISAISVIFVYLTYHFIFYSKREITPYSHILYIFGGVYLLFAFFWNLKLGLFADSDLLVSPSIAFALLILLSHDIEKYSQKHLFYLQNLAIINCLVSSFLLPN
jgi:hypothetical protein